MIQQNDRRLGKMIVHLGRSKGAALLHFITNEQHTLEVSGDFSLPTDMEFAEGDDHWPDRWLMWSDKPPGVYDMAARGGTIVSYFPLGKEGDPK